MILNIKLLGALFAILFMAAIITLSTGDYLISLLCIVALGFLSSHMKKNEKFYESEIDELYPDDKLV